MNTQFDDGGAYAYAHDDARRPPLDRVAIPNPDKPGQPDALTRIEILVGQLKFLDADGLAALLAAIREQLAGRPPYTPSMPMSAGEIAEILGACDDVRMQAYRPGDQTWHPLTSTGERVPEVVLRSDAFYGEESFIPTELVTVRIEAAA